MAVGESLLVLAVTGLGEIRPGDDLAALIAEHAPLSRATSSWSPRRSSPRPRAAWSGSTRSDPGRETRSWPKAEAVRVLRRRGDLVVTETRHGFVCANSGVDLSNVAEGWAALLPEDPDRSARRLVDGLRARTGLEVAVVISDTFGRAWRRGVTDVAIGCAGIRGRGRSSWHDRRPRTRARRDRDLRRGRDRGGRRPRHGKGARCPRGHRQGRGPLDARSRGRRRRGGAALRRGLVPVRPGSVLGAALTPPPRPGSP